MTTPVLATRGAVKAALDIAETARANSQIDDAIAAASEDVEADLHRTFRPLLATYSFAWPPRGGRSRPWRLWLDQHDLISVTSLVSAGTTIPAANYFLEPVNSGPPFHQIQINLAESSSFDSSDTWQQQIVVAGLWGHSDNSRPAGALAEDLDTTETAVDVTDGTLVDVGDVLLVNAERLNVTERDWLDSGTTLGADAAQDKGVRTVTVADGTAINVGEQILVNAETMLVTAIIGNTLTVRRSVDGSTLGAHSSGATVSVSRRMTVERAALGTTATSHTTADALTVHVVPRLVAKYVVGSAMVILGLERSGYAKESGSGNTKNDASGGGLEATAARARRAYKRKARFRTVAE